MREFAQRVNGGETTAYAVLTDDIDLSEICSEEEGDSWTPIGNEEHLYTGTFDGNGHTISGLYIDSSSANYQGLFGYVSGTVQNLTVSGSVSGSGNSVGGVVGYNDEGRVENCHNTGTVSGPNSGSDSNVGGVVGDNNSTVENCYNTGNISGNKYVGGVVGYNSSIVGYNSSTVENCYNTGKVTGGSSVGGVVGYNDGGISASASVTNCYNIGKVSGPDSVSGSYVGGVVGLNSSSGGSGNVTGCYFLKQNGMNESLQGIGNDDSATGAAAVNDLPELCKKFENDTDTWSIHPVLGRPVLNENKEGGDGSPDSPYEISTADQLENFRDIVNGANNQTADTDAHAVLMDDIDLNPGMTYDDDGQPSNPDDLTTWGPIGTNSKPYTGTFDGNGKTIKNLYVKNTDG